MQKVLVFTLICLSFMTAALASSPMEREIQRQLNQIRSIGEQDWGHRMEKEREQKEAQEERSQNSRQKIVLSSK